MDKIQNGDKFSVVMDKMNKAMDYCVPIGCIMPYAGTKAPDGWLLCNGASYNISQYSELAKVLGYTATSGSFNIPDLRNKYLKGNAKLDDGVISDTGTLWTSQTRSAPYGNQMAHEQGYVVFSTESGKVELPFVGLNFIIKY